MNTYKPTENQPSFTWSSCEVPPLVMAQEELSSGYQPEGFVSDGFVPGRPAEKPAAGAPPSKKSANSFLRQMLLLVSFGMLCLVAYYAMSRFVVTPVVIQGRSMTPTLRDGECYFLNRFVYRFKAPARGDLVVLKDPGHNDFAVKRIIGLPGDWLTFRDGKVFLNGNRLAEPYLPKGTYTATADSQEKWVQLGNEHYFVMGDNRACSEDSRVYGRILRENIVGAIRN